MPPPPGAPPAAPADALFADLTASYMEVAWESTAYREWLVRNDGPLPIRM
ncbi:hypothetical protein [Streptomyces rimosus]|nr:hypothetical protein [Streptomyces rimosus]